MATASYLLLAQTGASGSTGNNSATLTANTNTILYQVPASTQTVVSTITVCNQASTAATFNIAVIKAGTTVATQNYVAYGTPIAGNDTIALTLGITLSNAGTGDTIVVYSSTSTLSFSAFGSQIA